MEISDYIYVGFQDSCRLQRQFQFVKFDTALTKTKDKRSLFPIMNFQLTCFNWSEI